MTIIEQRMKINTIFAVFYKFYAVETMKLFRKWEGIFYVRLLTKYVSTIYTYRSLDYVVIA